MTRLITLAILAGLGACSNIIGIHELEPGDGGSSGPSDAGVDGSGTTDAGRDYTTDRSQFFGASRCGAAHVALCEDFEALAPSAAWSASGGSLQFDTVHAARGARAWHITVSGNGIRTLGETATFPALADGYYGRMFVYFGQLPDATGPTYQHWVLVAATSTGQGDIRLGGQYQSSRNLFGVGTDDRRPDAGTGDWTTSDGDPTGSPQAPPLDTWLCLEWQHDAANDVTKFWWDGVEHPSLGTTASHHGGDQSIPFTIGPLTAVKIGWQEYQPSTQSYDMWIDEVAIDNQRIGCVL